MTIPVLQEHRAQVKFNIVSFIFANFSHATVFVVDLQSLILKTS